MNLFSSAPTIHAPANLVVIIGCSAIGLAALIAAGLRRPPHVLRWLILAAFVAEALSGAAVWAQTAASSAFGKRYPALTTTDSAILAELASVLFVRGHNPYDWDYSGALELYRTDHAAMTANLAGTGESLYVYPALSFLLAAPFQLLHLPAAFCLILLAQVAMLIMLFLAAPEALRPLILLPLGVGISFTALTSIGVLDLVWAAFIVAMILAWRKPAWRAVFFGLAISFKQMPWLVIPFLLIRLWRAEEEGTQPVRRIAMFAVIAALIFLVINGPFIVLDPVLWFRSVIEPINNLYVFLSQGGLSALTQYGFVYLPKSYYVVAALSVFGVLLFCYWRDYAFLRDTFWILPGIVLWFSYRGLVTYWLLWVLPMLATLAAQWRFRLADLSVRVWRRTLATIGGVLVVLCAVGVAAASPAALDVTVRPPMLVNANAQITHLDVEITDHSNVTIAPRIAIQYGGTESNPIPWRIDAGPLLLRPAETALYHVSASDASDSFSVWEAAQIVVTDARGNYDVRGVTTINQDHSFLWPDAIANPAFIYWNATASSPVSWGVRSTPAGSGTAALVMQDGRDALALSLSPTDSQSNVVSVETSMPFPLKPFGIWLYADQHDDQQGQSAAYGIETDDGNHRLWLLFGPLPYSGPSPAQVVVNRTIPARQWVYQEIDLAQAYTQAGWQIPNSQPAVYRGPSADFRLVRLRLFLATNRPQSTLRAYFGPLMQDDFRVSPETLMAETLADPGGYYTRLGDLYLKQSNYGRAVEAYRRALKFLPGDKNITSKLDSASSVLAQEYAH